MLIHPIDELNLMEELGEVASTANKGDEAMNVKHFQFWECKINNFTCVNLGTHNSFAL